MGSEQPRSHAVLEEGIENSDVFTHGLFQELRMEIAKQELIVQAREAASRVLRALSGTCGSGRPLWFRGHLLPAPHRTAPSRLHADRQTSERRALDARKREQFQRLKEQFVKDQEVGVRPWVGAGSWGPALTCTTVCCAVLCCAAAPGGQAGGSG